jgi:hypothetical protein
MKNKIKGSIYFSFLALSAVCHAQDRHTDDATYKQVSSCINDNVVFKGGKPLNQKTLVEMLIPYQQNILLDNALRRASQDINSFYKNALELYKSNQAIAILNGAQQKLDLVQNPVPTNNKTLSDSPSISAIASSNAYCNYGSENCIEGIKVEYRNINLELDKALDQGGAVKLSDFAKNMAGKATVTLDGGKLVVGPYMSMNKTSGSLFSQGGLAKPKSVVESNIPQIYVGIEASAVGACLKRVEKIGFSLSKNLDINSENIQPVKNASRR